MTSPIDICNQALQEASARGSIRSFTENSSEAGAARTFYEAVRDQVLRAARWNCAQITDTLTLLKAMPGTPENPIQHVGPWTNAFPPPPWLYCYAYPASAIAFWKVQHNGNTIANGTPIFSTPMSTAGFSNQLLASARFKVALVLDAQGNPHKSVLTNAQQALGTWSMVVADPNVWDANLREAVVQALAGKFAAAVSGKMDVARMRMQTANNLILAARAADANEGLTIWTHEADWLRARGGPAFGAMPGGVFGAYGDLMNDNNGAPLDQFVLDRSFLL